MLFEALVSVGFFALAVPFGYLTRRVKRSNLDAVRRWPLALAVIHTPVVPLVLYVKLGGISLEFELVLVAVVLLGHTTGLLVHRMRHAARAPAPAPAALQE